ncbi:MAG: bifunctional hydroxymethylpyrimidine kinase/phosphomethylpyrimidine kinase [Pseudomonadota bacterium]
MIALTIAGSDSGGGAGIQADLKTFSALGVYGASVLTAVTAQNTLGVTAVHGIPPDIVRAQIEAVLSDLDVAAIKIGMVGEAAVIETIAAALASFDGPVVLDPVMVAASGDRLISDGAAAVLKARLFPLATLVTPNLPEAAALLMASSASGLPGMEAQARALAADGPSVLLKGGHLAGDSVDLLLHEGRAETFPAPRIETKNTHGTGCTLSSAIAAHLAKGASLKDAVAAAKRYVTAAIGAADTLSIGKGHGPVHHFHGIWDR